MAKLNPARGAQWPLVSEFTFSFDDTVVATDGAVKPFTAPLAAEVINLPDNAVVIDGEIVVDVAFNAGTTYTASVGDTGSATRYGSALSLAAAGRKALTPTGYHATGNLQLTIATTGSPATAGKATLRVMYVIPDRVNEVQPN